MTTSSDWAVRLLDDPTPPGGSALASRLWRTAVLPDGGRSAVLGPLGDSPLEAPRHERLVSLPGTGAFDLVICASALATLGQSALPQLAQRLAPGGSLVLAELVAEAPLPPAVAALLGRFVPYSGTVEALQHDLLDAGLRVHRYADEGEALEDWLLRIKRRLLIARLGGQVDVGQLPTDLREARRALTATQRLASTGRLQWVRLAASRGVPHPPDPSFTGLVGGCDPLTGCC